MLTKHTGKPSLTLDLESGSAPRHRPPQPLPAVPPAGAVVQFHLFPLSLEWVADLLAAAAARYMVIMDVDYHPNFEPISSPRDLPRLLRSQHIDCLAHTALRDKVVIRSADLTRLLAAIWHHNFHCWDTPTIPVTPAFEALPLSGDAVSLRRLGPASFFLDSHDDSYFSLECRGDHLVRPLLTRALASVALHVDFSSDWELSGTRPSKPESLRGHVDDAPQPLVERLLSAGNHLYVRGEPVAARPSRARLSYAPLPPGPRIMLSAQSFEWIGHLEYDFATRVWRHRFAA